MLKIAVLGITGIFTALFLKEIKSPFAVYISLVVCLIIFYYAVSKLTFLKDSLKTLLTYINMKENYLEALLKIMGITYVADFSASMCKDAGYLAIASQIEFFGRISILSVSMPIILALLETIHDFLV